MNVLGRRWAWAMLGMVVVATLAWVAWPQDGESAEERAHRIASELRCVECEGLSVADASTSTARATRDEIDERIEAGESDAEIRQAYIDRYGERILMNPTSSGLGVIVWVLPVVVVALGGAGVAFAVRRRHGAPRIVATPADEALVGAVADRSRGEPHAASRTFDGDPLLDERDFLLRSLDDLDAEYATGEVDAETYQVLRADYTARAASMLRGLAGDDPPPDSEPSVSWQRRALVLGVVVVFAGVAGVMLAFALGARLPGGLPTGDEVQVSPDEREQRLRQAVADNPDDPSAYLALASFLEGEDIVGALEAYDTAARLDPADPVPLAQAGWLLFFSATATDDTEQRTALLEGARERLDAAVLADADYPDARFYRGMVLYRGYGDAEAAIPELQRFLVLAPDHPLAEQGRDVLAEAVAASN